MNTTTDELPQGLKGLTRRQREFIEAFHDLRQRKGKPPTYRELMVVLGIRFPNGVQAHVAALVKKGWMRRGTHGESRSMELTDGARDHLRTPGDRPTARAEGGAVVLEGWGGRLTPGEAVELAKELAATANEARNMGN